MDLTTLATDEAARTQAAAEAARRRRDEQEFLNDRTALKDLFVKMFGVHVADDEIIVRGKRNFVIVDGVAMALAVEDPHLSYDKSKKATVFGAYVIDGDEARRCDTSLTASQVHDLAELGRILEPGRCHSVTFYEPAPGKQTGFHSRNYQVGHGLLDYGVRKAIA